MSKAVTIVQIANALPNDEARLDYLLSYLKFIEGNVKEPDCGRLCKSLSGEIVQSFNNSALFRTDIRAFEIWKYFAKYSHNLGYGKVMENIYSLGLFMDLVEYYECWAEYEMKRGDMAKVAKIEQYAMENCSDKNRVAEIFKNWTTPDETENILMNIRGVEKPEPVVPSLKKPLSVVNEDSNKIEGDDIDGTFIVERNEVPPASYSFTTHLIKNEVDLYGQTLPLSQEPQHFPTIPVLKESPKAPEVEKDFSIFRDIEDSDIRGVVRPFIKENVVSESPMAKRLKPRKNLDDSVDFDKVFGTMALDNKLASPELNKMTIPIIADENTVAGYGKYGSTMISTPIKDNGSRPTFEVSPTQTFAFAQKKQNDPVVSDVKPFVFSMVPDVEKPNTTRNLVSETLKQNDLAVVDDDFETTRDYSICGEAKVTSDVNPWGKAERSRILSRAPPMVEQHDFLTTKSPSFKLSSEITMGGESFKIIKLIGRGGFAKVFQASKEDGSKVAIKFEVPACPWEVYMCKIAVQRLSEVMQPFVMNIQDAYIFSNASAIVYDYHPRGTLLDLVNAYRKDNILMNGQVVSFIGAQIASVIGYLHRAQIIHTDIKPDNFVTMDYLKLDEPKRMHERPFIKLIDWGRGIDMSFFNKQSFIGRAGTDGFDCTEMVEGRPWNYHPDYFGFVGTMHVLIFGKYMKTSFNNVKKSYVISEIIKTRYPLSDIWKRVFNAFLNIPDCENLPDWFAVVKDVREALEEYVDDDPRSWQASLNQCNEMLRSLN
uniref:Protein kinase domain-containing protein n=1 Tax=Panagrolaimus sp. JU765 TaxID=591449 RepID=A0AC34RD56_9BILA